MKHLWICILVISLLCLVIGQTPAYATSIIPATLESMTSLSDLIVVGQVKSQQSYWEGQKIFTDVVIDVEESVKNAPPETAATITLKILGGTVGDVSFEIDQAPVFQVGEKTLLFLKKIDGSYFPFAFSYGVYRVIFDEARQQEFVDGPFFQYSEHFDLKTMEPVTISEELLTEEGKELNSFINRVKQLVQ